MNKLTKTGLATALRARSISSWEQLTPKQIEDMGHRLVPAQKVFGPKSARVEKWQKHYQDPLNALKPMYRRKGVSDDLIFVTLSIAVLYNLGVSAYTYCTSP